MLVQTYLWHNVFCRFTQKEVRSHGASAWHKRKVSDKVADMVADMELDMVADMEIDKVADIEVNMVADMEVNMMADINIDI